MEPEPGLLAEYFDGWYADMTGSPAMDEIQQRHLGLPPPDVHQPARLGRDRRGRRGAAAVSRRHAGGSGLRPRGLWPGIAARTGARLVGVDFSAEAVRQAREHARRLGATAEFRIGDLAATGLGAGSAGAVLCVDAIQFAQEPDAAYREIKRVLASGGRAVLTCWEPLDRDDERLPGRLRRVDLGAGLAAAGFGNVEVRDRPGWRACERAMWEEAAALDPGDDPALRSFHDEGVRSLEIFGLVRRVIATATAP